MEFNVVEYKRILLETFRAFIEFCDRNEIRYVAAYGTVLGAVRHKGLIPWDDDIDLYITRDNWNKLRHLVETEDVLPEGRSLVYKENTPYYCNPLPRYVDTTTTHQIAVAPTKAQADETLSPIRTAIAIHHGPLLNFMTMGNKESLYLIKILHQICCIRNNEINSQHIICREGQSAIHNNNTVFIFKGSNIHSNLFKTTKRNNFNWCFTVVFFYCSGIFRLSRTAGIIFLARG